MINVITPFSRPENARLVRDHLSWQRVAVTWHPVVSSVALPVDCLRAWVKPLRTSVPAGDGPVLLEAAGVRGERADCGRGAVWGAV
jgi:hypothetical protein